jgi:hypothetical protein
MARLLVIIVVLSATLSFEGAIPLQIAGPASAAAADFGIRRMSLYFENRRPETTVDRSDQNLRAFADIATTGSGLLEGYWEVDGRLINRVSQHVVADAVVTLTTPKVPSLPTVDPGTHILRFVVTNPQFAAPAPSILYFVVPKEVSCRIVAINLLGPADGSEVDYAPVTFKWEKNSDSTHYLVAFSDRPDGTPVFSASVQADSYTLPETVIKMSFTPGEKYYWKVTGFDKENNTICENRRQSFVFRRSIRKG